MRPCQELHVEAAVPDPEATYFHLNLHQLDGAKTLAPQWVAPGNTTSPVQPFRLDISVLDGPDLIEQAGGGDIPNGMVWLSLMTNATSISIDRGMDTRQGIAARPTAGTMTANIIDPFFDALTNQEIGLTTLVRVRVDNEPIFVGNIIAIATDFTPNGLPELTFTAADGIAKLNSVPLPARPAETFAERVAGAAAPTALTYSTTGTGLLQRATDEPRTALETLYAAIDTEAGWAMVDRYNHLIAWPRGEAEQTPAPVYTLSDRHNDPQHDACITAIQTAVDTTRVINNLTVNNMRWDDSDPDPTRHRWVTDTFNYASPSSTDFYGVARHTFTTFMDDSLLVDYKDFIFTHYEKPLRHVAGVEYLTDDFTAPGVPRIALIDVGDPVAITVRAPATGAATINVTERVVRINHQITPTRWTTQLAVA